MDTPQGLCTYTSCNKFPRFTCTRCRCAKYCSVECQTAHYKFHREGCFATEKYIKEGKKISRLVLVTEDTFEQMKKEIEKGNIFKIESKKGEAEEIIKRVDNKYYEKNSGNRIVSMEEYNNQKGVEVKMLTNWGNLMIKYGDAEVKDDEYYLFVDRKNKKAILLNKNTDKIVAEQDLPQLGDDIKLNIIKGSDGKVYIMGYKEDDKD